MTKDEIQKAALAVLREIAPEVEGNTIVPDVNFRDQFDFDSMDFLRFVIALGERLQIDIPEIDYPKLSSLDSCAAYLATKLP